jgi:hypothetical protein
MGGEALPFSTAYGLHPFLAGWAVWLFGGGGGLRFFHMPDLAGEKLPRGFASARLLKRVREGIGLSLIVVKTAKHWCFTQVPANPHG